MSSAHARYRYSATLQPDDAADQGLERHVDWAQRWDVEARGFAVVA